MPRRERIAVAMPDHSLAARKDHLDRELDEAIERGKVDKVVGEVKAKHAKDVDADAGAQSRPRIKVERDPMAHYRDEIEVVRKCVLNGHPRGRDRDIGGSLGRSLERHALGTSGIASSSRAFEPDLGSDHYRHAWACWMSLRGDERNLLTAMFAALDTTADRGADHIAKVIAGHLQHGKLADAAAALPAWAVELAPEQAKAPVLVAIRFRWWRADAQRLEDWPDSRAVSREVKSARARLKAALRRVELDASGESLLTRGDGVASGMKPLLIPAASSRELSRERQRAPVAACVGLGAILDGARLPCAVEVVELDVESAATCAACGRPRA